MSVRVLHSDMREVLPTLSGLDACVCDPPYHLTSGNAVYDLALTGAGNERTRRVSRGGGFMGKQWDGGDIALRPDTWRLVYDALKPGAHLLAFGGSRTFARMFCAIEDAGFEYRDTLMFLYGTGFPKSHDISKAIDKAAGAEREIIGPRANLHSRGNHSMADGWRRPWMDDQDSVTRSVSETAPATPEAFKWQGWGTALKPAFEPIGMFRKPLDNCTVAANVLKHGTGAINVDACRIPAADGYAENRVTQGGKDGGGFDIGSSDGTRHSTFEPSQAGRWPANVLHDGSDEVEAAFAAFANSEASPSRYFASFPLFYDNANTILEECQLRIASIAKGSSSLPSASSVSVLTYAVTQASCGEAQLKSCQGLGETVTVKNLIAICRSAIAQILNIEPRLSPERKLDSLTPLYSHARSVDQNTPIGITTITISLSKSDGSVEHVICNTMQPKIQSGAQKDVLRFNYSAKASKADRAGSKHPTIKPLNLMRWLVRLVTPPGGTVLDCFAGSGTTGEAAMLEGFNAVLVEREDEYIADINRRIERATQERTTIITTAQLDMFG